MQQTEKPMATMERELARRIENDYRGDFQASAMEALDELFNEPQPLPVLERCLDICIAFDDIDEGSIAPRYFIILRALIFEAKMRTQGTTIK